MCSNKVIYSLCIQDIQVVALEILDRKLTKEELDKVLGPIADRISWYDVIEEVITQEIEFNSDKP